MSPCAMTRPMWSRARTIQSSRPDLSVQQIGSGSAAVTYLPALAIPVERKPAMLRPSTHQAALEADLEQATGMLTVGWRAREDHFLQVIADKLPSRRRLPLFTVGWRVKITFSK